MKYKLLILSFHWSIHVYTKWNIKLCYYPSTCPFNIHKQWLSSSFLGCCKHTHTNFENKNMLQRSKIRIQRSKLPSFSCGKAPRILPLPCGRRTPAVFPQRKPPVSCLPAPTANPLIIWWHICHIFNGVAHLPCSTVGCATVRPIQNMTSVSPNDWNGTFCHATCQLFNVAHDQNWNLQYSWLHCGHKFNFWHKIIIFLFFILSFSIYVYGTHLGDCEVLFFDFWNMLMSLHNFTDYLWLIVLFSFLF